MTDHASRDDGPSSSPPSAGHQPHDAFFKDLFTTFFADLVQLAAPSTAEALDFARARDQKTALAAGLGAPRTGEVDLLVRVPLRDPPAPSASGDASDAPRILVHIEIEARFRREMDARMARYGHQLCSQHDRPILPLVVFLRGGPAARAVRGVAQHAGPFLHALCFYIALCLERCDPSAHLARDEPLAWGLAALMRAGGGDRARQKLAILQRIAAAGNRLTRQQRYLLTQTVSLYLPLQGADAERYAEMIQEQPEEIQDMIPRTYQQVIEEGRQIGVQEGRQIGVQEGRQIGVQEGRQIGVEEGQQRIVRRLIERRFGPLSDDDRARLDAIDDPDALDRLAERVFDAPSVAALLR
ncbi:MAG: DUF4351 domain-containing protein [Acidobacteriota bacterium]